LFVLFILRIPPQRAILPVPQKESFVSDKDYLVLEDETGRIQLVGDSFNVHEHITGI